MKTTNKRQVRRKESQLRVKHTMMGKTRKETKRGSGEYFSYYGV